MIGLTALAILVVYILSVRKLTRFIARLAGFDESAVKVLILFFAFLLLPFVDEIVGRVQFKQECKKVQGYKVSDAIKGAMKLRYDYSPRADEKLRTFIPITKGTERVIDVASGAVVLQFEALRTPGGWLMRSGLNLGNSSYCNSVNTPKVLKSHGFEYVKDGFFERIVGAQ